MRNGVIVTGKAPWREKMDEERKKRWRTVKGGIKILPR